MPGNTADSQRLAAHKRFHVKRGIIKPNCVLCQLAQHAAGGVIDLPASPVPVSPHGGIGKAKAQLAITSTLVEFDVYRANSMAERQRSLDECALIFNMTPDGFRDEIKKAFGITWEELACHAPIKLFNDVEAAIWRAAKNGDVRFIGLLIELKKLPGWNAPPRPVIGGGIVEQPPRSAYPDLSKISTEELQEIRKRAQLLALEKVIDRVGRFDKPGKICETLEVLEATPEDASKPLGHWPADSPTSVSLT